MPQYRPRITAAASTQSIQLPEQSENQLRRQVSGSLLEMLSEVCQERIHGVRFIKPSASSGNPGFQAMRGSIVPAGIMDASVRLKSHRVNFLKSTAVSYLKFPERGCARSVSRSAWQMLRLVFNTAALRQIRTLPLIW